MGYTMPVTGMPVGQSLDHCTGMPVAGLALCGHKASFVSDMSVGTKKVGSVTKDIHACIYIYIYILLYIHASSWTPVTGTFSGLV